MPDSPHPDQLTFKLHPAGGGSEVPAAVLAQSLTTLQELIDLFALQEEGRSLRQRLRMPEELKNKYVLCCRPPVPGSFSIAGRVANLTDDATATGKITAVMTRFHGFNEAASLGEVDEMSRFAPDRGIRTRALDGLIKLCPPAGSGYRAELFNGTAVGLQLTESLPARLERLRKSPVEEAELQTVTGRLEVIEFSERKITISYAPKGRWLECTYDESVEPMLLEKRRDLIQVTGRVIMDDENHPKKIVEVEQVRDLDLSPFVLGELKAGEVELKLRRSLQLQPILSENEQLIRLEYDAWSLDVFAQTRSELFEELQEQLAMLWLEYACEGDEALSDPALRVKQQLRADWEEVTHA